MRGKVYILHKLNIFMAEGLGHFVELIIATTVGSIVGAFIAHGIELNADTFFRALFATCVLMIFFFLIWQISKNIGPRDQKRFKGTSERKERPLQKRFSYEENESAEENLEEGTEDYGEADNSKPYEEDYDEADEENYEVDETEDLKEFREKIKQRRK